MKHGYGLRGRTGEKALLVIRLTPDETFRCWLWFRQDSELRCTDLGLAQEELGTLGQGRHRASSTLVLWFGVWVPVRSLSRMPKVLRVDRLCI